MHDGAPAHYAQSIRHFLNKAFNNRWIAWRGPIDWPVQYPDLTQTDFFLQDLIKDRVYEAIITEI